MSENSYESCLEPFKAEIIALRRHKRPMSCAKIAKYLLEKHQITVHRQTIYDFLKVRAKGFKPCKYAWNIDPVNAENQPVTEASSVPARPGTTVSAVQKGTPKQPASEKTAILDTSDWEIKPFEMEFSETYNLTRMSPEVAAARNKIIEEKIRAKYYPNKQPTEK